MQTENAVSSSVFSSIPLASGNGCYLGHYCTEIATLRLRMLSTRGGLPGGRVLIIWRKRARTKRFRQLLRMFWRSFNLHGDRLPNSPGPLDLCIRPDNRLCVKTFQVQLFGTCE